MKARLSFLALIAFGLFAYPALAQSKFTDLDDMPAIMNRIEYRDDRFEIVPLATITLTSGLRQHFLFGARLKYHLSDVFALGITGFGGFSTPTATFTDVISVQDRNQDAAADLPGGEGDLEANGDVLFDDLRRVREVKFGAGLDAEFTPIYGKMSLFGKLEFRYDFSAILGVSAVQTDEIIALVDTAADEAPRIIPAPHFGMGARLFLSDFLALNLEVRDTLVLDNLDGGVDGAGNPVAELNNFVTLAFGTSIFFPTVPKVGK